MNFKPENPLIVQSDMTILLETMGPHFDTARDFLNQFAELHKSPEYLHTYGVTPLSLWNAAAAGVEVEGIIEGLRRLTKYDVPPNVFTEIREQMARYGKVKLLRLDETDEHILQSDDPIALEEILASPQVRPFLSVRRGENQILILPGTRGRIKQALIKIGFPVEDLAGYVQGDPLEVTMREETVSGLPFSLREYQRDAAEVFYANGARTGGSGVLVLPCGAGKTVIGIAAMSMVGQHTLILTTNLTALRQWKREIADKTTLTEDQIGEYSGEVKDVKPVTVTTYQILTYKKSRNDEFLHMDLFQKYNWGLMIYDEVHLLPAPVFRATTEIQARRRLGLTATLVREDGKEDDVFSLIGPKRLDKPWKELEAQGWIAQARCMEIRVPMAEDKRLEYAVAELRNKYRLSMENPSKLPVVECLLKKHKEDNVLIIGQYLDQLEAIRELTGAPIITGETPNSEREVLYNDFKTGKNKVLIVSKVANFAVDLPDANVAIQISGTFRSRQEETQRLGRVLRPKTGGNFAYFYSVVTKDTKDQECAKRRSLFLTEQGYRYRIRVLSGLDFTVDDLSFDSAEDGIVESLAEVPVEEVPDEA
ncbi:helicase [candidate division BRC1 bacterium HGW-BRC1-1]|jgi:DNA excision repair protein ERCC-3|nr:MAG: helicase [candidate division BRC1 bacterium HGW-BRC1-1]